MGASGLAAVPPRVAMATRAGRWWVTGASRCNARSLPGCKQGHPAAHLAEAPDTTVVVRGPGRVKARFGDPITVRANTDAVHVFDVSSGERLE